MADQKNSEEIFTNTTDPVIPQEPAPEMSLSPESLVGNPFAEHLNLVSPEVEKTQEPVEPESGSADGNSEQSEQEEKVEEQKQGEKPLQNEGAHAEPAKDSMLFSNDDIKIRDQIDDIDKQVAASGSYTERYYKDGQLVENEYSAKDAQELRRKLVRESERLRNISWMDRTYKEWSLRWILAKVAQAVRYVVSPTYRSMCRDAATLERRADLDAQYKAYVERKAEKIKESMEQQEKSPQERSKAEPETKQSPEITKSETEKVSETKASEKEIKETPEQVVDTEQQKKEVLYQKIQEDMAKKSITKEEAIERRIVKFPRDIIYLEKEDLNPFIAEMAFSSAMAYRERNMKNMTGIFDDHQRWEQTKYLVAKFPPMILAFDPDGQKKLFVSAALKNPEVLTYMNPEISKDQELTVRLKAAIEDITEKNINAGKQPPNYQEKLFKPLYHEYKDLGAVPAFLANMETVFGKEFLDQMVGDTHMLEEPAITENEPVESQVIEAPEVPVQEEIPIPVVAEIPEPEPVAPPVQQQQDDFAFLNTFPESPAMEEPPIPWNEQPVFEEAVQSTQIELIQLYGSIMANPDIETLKQEVIQRHPDLIQHLPDEEKTTDVIVTAVSKNLSLIRYIPEQEKLPDYNDRDELKQQIYEAVCNSVIDTARTTGKQPMEILRGQVCKESGEDTRESREMKKALRNKGFELNQKMEREISMRQER